jgi:hypothetical protein
VTSEQDERALLGAKGRESIAKALESAVLEFGRRYDARRGHGETQPASAEGR